MTSLKEINDRLENIENLLKKILGEEITYPYPYIIRPIYIPDTAPYRPYEIWCDQTTSKTSDCTIHLE